MGLFANDLDPRYELLSEPRRRKEWRFGAHYWVILGAIILLITLIIISISIIWNRKAHQGVGEDLDFVLFGPHKETADMIRVSEYRSLMYALDMNNSTKHVEYPEMLGKKRFDTFEHMNGANYSLVCYYVVPNRSAFVDHLMPEGMDPFLCTHIIISFSVVRNNTVCLPSEYEDKIFRSVVNLKKSNPNLKVLLSVVSFASITDTFGAMVATRNNRKRFISSALNIAKNYSLDGIDIDWEFPAWPITKDSEQKQQFVDLLKEMRTAFGYNYLISVAVAAPVTIIKRAYDIPAIAKYVDFVNIMCYDYHAFVWYVPFTGPNAPLYRSESDIGYYATLNTNYTTYYWMHEGMPKDKIIVGIPSYGHSWTLVYPAVHGYGALAKGFGSIGEKGFVSYKDVCSFVNLKDSTIIFDGYTLVPYAYRQNEWISFDNAQSVAYKVELITELGLKGAMVFSLNQDDFTGKYCSEGTYPLTKAVKKALDDDDL